MKDSENPPNTHRKYYEETSVFQPGNLLREARRQKNIQESPVPHVCILDPDGDLVRYLRRTGKTKKNRSWACYHSEMYTYDLEGTEIGIIPCAVGASYSVLVAEQLFVSGCEFLISVTSAGIITDVPIPKKFALITEAIRDEGTSYHYLPANKQARISTQLLNQLQETKNDDEILFFEGKSWTTDAPYRETVSSINMMKEQNVTCVEMEAAALYAFAEYTGNDVTCFAHLTNSMAQDVGDFEKGEEFGSLDTLHLIKKILDMVHQS